MADVPYDNEKIIEWGRKNLNNIKTEIDSLDIKHSPKSPNPKALRNSIGLKFRNRNGLITRISYSFPRTAVYVHKGVGRGTKISQVGTTNRVAKRWFDNPTDRNMPELQNIVAANDATYVLNNLRIK